MFDPNRSDFKLGILGGGQLGRMLIQSCIDFNLTTYVMDSDRHAPARHVCHQFIEGDIQDYYAVYRFGKMVDLLTIEIEHVNIDALFQLEEEGIIVYPQPSILLLIQDKGLQKTFYIENNIPTTPFKFINNRTEVFEHSNEFPKVLKLRKGGYDGKGVLMFNEKTNLHDVFDEKCILEDLVDFEKEISVIVSRNKSGEISNFPPVEAFFHPKLNLVDFLLSPANVTEEISNEAIRIARLVAEKLEIIGILAVEMFLTKDGKILVNEIAPRPHNSGHQSMEANITSQFEQHLRALGNLPLGSTEITQPSIMINILGEPGYEGLAKYQGINEVLKIAGSHIHLYGKLKTKPNRKMGHVTVTAPTIEEALEKAEFIKNTLKVIC